MKVIFITGITLTCYLTGEPFITRNVGIYRFTKRVPRPLMKTYMEYTWQTATLYYIDQSLEWYGDRQKGLDFNAEWGKDDNSSLIIFNVIYTFRHKTP